MQNKNFKTQSINIDSIYTDLKAKMSKRQQLQGSYENMLRQVKSGKGKSRELSNLSNQIGGQTHAIHQIISKLCQYTKTHKAMKLANDYLSGEIKRSENIINKWNNKIRAVESGREILIDSNGNMTTNTKDARAYVKQKQESLNRLKKWKKHVSKYIS